MPSSRATTATVRTMPNTGIGWRLRSASGTLTASATSHTTMTVALEIPMAELRVA
jgi:hypothetical protein